MGLFKSKMQLGNSVISQKLSPFALAKHAAGKRLPRPIYHILRRLLKSDRWPLSEHELRYDLNQIQAFESILSRNDLSIHDFPKLLDFACGPARLMRHMPILSPQTELHGCDTDPWCIYQSAKLCPTGTFYVNDIEPPLNYEDDSFDMIWSFSIFTSLPESKHKIWMKELSRILKPGGVMLHTVHSYEYLKRSRTFSPERIEKYQLPLPLEQFIIEGPDYYYIADDPKTPDYGQALISKRYIKDIWPSITGLKLVDYRSAAIESYPEGCHDLVMMSKPLYPQSEILTI